jgi:sigma-B regulation protein RsbU (phosphoserine phosphatase)
MNKITGFAGRNIQAIIITVTGVILAIALMNLYYVMNYLVNSNDECLWMDKTDKHGQNIIEILKVKTDGVTYNSGIRNNDILVKINKIKVKNTYHAMRILNTIKSGDVALYEVERNGKTFEANVFIKKLLPFNQLAFSIVSIIWLIIGFVVIMAKPAGRMQRIFYSIGVLWVLMLIYVYLYKYPFSLAEYVIDFTFITSGMFLPYLMLHFFWIFPKPFKFVQNKWVFRILYSVPSLFLLVLYPIRIYNLIHKQEMLASLPINMINLSLFVCGIAGLVFLIISYVRLKTREERKPLFIILTAYAIAILTILYVSYIAPVISDTIFNSPMFYMPIILVVIIPIAFGISIFRYQLMDVSIVIKNTIIYGLATVAIAAVYFLIIYLLGTYISSAVGTQYKGVVAGVVFIAFAIVFQSTKDKFQDFLTAKFYPEQFAAQKVLLTFSNEVATVVGLTNILDSMNTTFIENLKINNFAILLKDKNNCDYKYIRGTGIKNSGLSVDGKYLDIYLKGRMQNDMSVVLERENFYAIIPENAGEMIDENIYTVIPMVIKSRVIGLLLFGLKYSGAQFGGKDLELLIAAANQAAISIENARLYKTEAEKERIERDLDLARKIQESLLPKEIPDMPSLDIYGQMIPAMQVGGDYFDFIKVSPSKVFVMVGDVSGKGLSASLYMTKLQTIMRLACTNNKMPKEILLEVNRQIFGALERNWFITLTLALFDTDKKKVWFCRAGHMPTLAAKNGCVNEYKSSGIGLGLEAGKVFNASLVEEVVELHSGEFFVFYSDGITEAMNKGGDLFGEENLISALKNKTSLNSKEIVDALWNKVTEFKQSAPQNDDMTIVLVKIG